MGLWLDTYLRLYKDLFGHLCCHAPFCVRFAFVSENAIVGIKTKRVQSLLHCFGLSYSYICKILAPFYTSSDLFSTSLVNLI